jgi:hypothetical protein
LRAYVLLTVLESNYESTFIEPPETPAHQFAVKAFKHAIFGTPAPEDAKDASKKSGYSKRESDRPPRTKREWPTGLAIEAAGRHPHDTGHSQQRKEASVVWLARGGQ